MNIFQLPCDILYVILNTLTPRRILQFMATCKQTHHYLTHFTYDLQLCIPYAQRGPERIYKMRYTCLYQYAQHISMFSVEESFTLHAKITHLQINFLPNQQMPHSNHLLHLTLKFEHELSKNDIAHLNHYFEHDCSRLTYLRIVNSNDQHVIFDIAPPKIITLILQQCYFKHVFNVIDLVCQYDSFCKMIEHNDLSQLTHLHFMEYDSSVRIFDFAQCDKLQVLSGFNLQLHTIPNTLNVLNNNRINAQVIERLPSSLHTLACHEYMISESRAYCLTKSDNFPSLKILKVAYLTYIPPTVEKIAFEYIVETSLNFANITFINYEGCASKLDLSNMFKLETLIIHSCRTIKNIHLTRLLRCDIQEYNHTLNFPPSLINLNIQLWERETIILPSEDTCLTINQMVDGNPSKIYYLHQNKLIRFKHRVKISKSHIML